MAKIVAYKSLQDGKIFENLSEYRSHLSRLARRRRQEKLQQQTADQLDQRWSKLYEQEISISDWPNLVLANQELFWHEAALNSGDGDWRWVGIKKHRGVECPRPKLLKFSHFDMSWNPEISNSHSAPHNGTQNWSRSPELPLHYPGWSGRVEWLVRWAPEWDGVYLGGDLFRAHSFSTGRQRAWTGTGGGGGLEWNKEFGCHAQTYAYDFCVFADDWPGMRDYLGKQQMWQKLEKS